MCGINNEAGRKWDTAREMTGINRQTSTKKGKDNMRDKKGILKLAGMVALSAALAFAPLKPVQAQEELPSVTVDSVTWDGGKINADVNLGDYTAEELTVRVGFEESFPFREEITENQLSFSLWDAFQSSDQELFFSKAGTYQLTVEFMDSGYNTISTDTIDVVVPTDSEQWKIPRSTVKFDGSEDIVFKFKNGTNFFEIGDVSRIHIFYGKLIGIDMYEGYTLDAAAGEVRIDKDAFINALKSYDYDENVEWDVPAENWEDVFIDVIGVTTKGSEIGTYFNTVDYVGDKPYIQTTIAWAVDLSELDLGETEQGKATAEFAGTSSEEISVSEATGAQIAESALDYVKANYSAELAALDSYTVSSKIELSEADEKELDQAVKNAFAPYLTEWKAGKYYKIQVAASVLKDGQPVEGLENIIIPSLSEDVQVMLKVPGNLQQDSRNYKMLHYQNGTAEMLDCEENEGIITFKTDSFSPFALVYRDAVENSGSTDGTGVNNMGAADNTVNPKTGDHEGMACVASLFVGSLSILALTVARKRSRL